MGLNCLHVFGWRYVAPLERGCLQIPAVAQVKYHCVQKGCSDRGSVTRFSSLHGFGILLFLSQPIVDGFGIMLGRALRGRAFAAWWRMGGYLCCWGGRGVACILKYSKMLLCYLIQVSMAKRQARMVVPPRAPL